MNRLHLFNADPIWSYNTVSAGTSQAGTISPLAIHIMQPIDEFQDSSVQDLGSRQITKTFSLIKSAEVIQKCVLICRLLELNQNNDIYLPDEIQSEKLVQVFCDYFNGDKQAIEKVYANDDPKSLLQAYLEAENFRSLEFDRAFFDLIRNKLSYLNFHYFYDAIFDDIDNPRFLSIIELLVVFACSFIDEWNFYNKERSQLNDNAKELFQFLEFFAHDQNILDRMKGRFGLSVQIKLEHIKSGKKFMEFLDLISPFITRVSYAPDLQMFINAYNRIRTFSTDISPIIQRCGSFESNISNLPSPSSSFSDDS